MQKQNEKPRVPGLYWVQLGSAVGTIIMALIGAPLYSVLIGLTVFTVTSFIMLRRYPDASNRLIFIGALALFLLTAAFQVAAVLS
jgi:hypothetical protein